MSPAAWGLDAHNIIIAGTNERDMRVALEAIKAKQGGVVVADGGKVGAMIELPVAGLLSDKPAREVQAETILLKKAWEALNCSLPYMGFNLIPLSVIPELRITDMGLVHVTGMKVIPLFE